MKYPLPNYSCLQNPWLGGYRPQIPVLSVLCPQLNLLNPPPKNSWVRHCNYILLGWSNKGRWEGWGMKQEWDQWEMTDMFWPKTWKGKKTPGRYNVSWMILKWILMNRIGGYGLDTSGSRGGTVSMFRKHAYAVLCSLRRVFIDSLNECWHLKNADL
jgi:hypothetical protein